MLRRAARPALLSALIAAALVAAGCGNRHEIQTHGETEGIYVDVGALDYQIQISRVLNPAIPPDNAYLGGIPEFVADPAEDEVWFGVFVRVQNQTNRAQPTAEKFHIVDTQHREYEPIALDPEENPFAYEPRMLPARETLPVPDSVQSLSSAQGSMLLFKLPHTALENRPLDLVIESPAGEPAEGSVNLDI